MKKIDAIHVKSMKKDKIYDQSTITTSLAIASLVDIIGDIDKLIDIGYDEYLNYVEEEFLRNQRIVCDTAHLRNFDIESQYSKKELEIVEKRAYAKRADAKLEKLFLETNKSLIKSLIGALKKIIKFSGTKNNRKYTLKELGRKGGKQ